MSTEYQPGEREALEALAESPDPMARVIYHMSMRQLSMNEKIINVENEVMSVAGKQRRLVYALERILNGSNPGLRAIVLGESG